MLMSVFLMCLGAVVSHYAAKYKGSVTAIVTLYTLGAFAFIWGLKQFINILMERI
jgi:uncharacterized membrane protein YqjE